MRHPIDDPWKVFLHSKWLPLTLFLDHPRPNSLKALRVSPTPPAVKIAVLSFLLLIITTSAFAQQADFIADITTGCFPLTVNFTDKSTGTVNSWQWDFGNNNKSTLQNPSAVFSAPGSYNITLVVSDGNTTNTRIKSAYIIVRGFPDVDLSFELNTGCAPLSVKFKDQTSTASGEISSWFWLFGDGGSSGSANPTYVYQQPGEYSISLKVRNIHGCEKTFTSPSTIKVLGPNVSFISNTSAICALPATFEFTNKSTGDSPITWLWTFGDGQTSTLANPNHTYTKGNTYNVSLKAGDVNGCESTYQMNVNAGSEGGLDFSASSYKVCLGETIDFNLLSQDAAVTSDWTFGDGSTAAIRNPQVTYPTPGIYTVTLTAQLLGHSCHSTISKKVEVAKPALPSFDKSIDCNYSLTLTSTSQNARRLEWYVNGALTSTAKSFVSPIKTPGAQSVRLIAFDDADCAYTLETEVTVPPNPIAAFLPDKQQACSGESLSGCAPFFIVFTNTTTSLDPVTYRWDFGDGGSSTSTHPSHTFVNKGLYQVTLTATNSKGCSATSTAFVIVSNTMPTADFKFDKTVACAGEDIKFTDNSLNADFWCWDFGDGSTDEGKEVLHRYAKPGKYSVKLTAKNAGCSSGKVFVDAITIKDPYVTFDASKSCGDPFNVNLKNFSANYDEMHWEFGDGQTSTDINVPNHRYAQEGTYVLKLIGTNFSTGCTTISFLPMIIQQVEADFTVNTDKPCKGSPLQLTDKSKAAVKWKWSLASETSEEQNYSTTIKTPGSFTARLDVEDSDGCTATKNMPITVLDMEGKFSFNATSTCTEFTVTFKNESTGSPAPTVFAWDFGDGQNSTDKNPVHIYRTPGKHNVALSVTNAQGTCAFVKTNAVNFTTPQPDFAVVKSKFCPGESIIVANTTINAISYEWDYGDGRRADFTSPVIVYDKPGSYDITLFAKDVYGCEKKIAKSAYINVVKPTASFSVAQSTGACPPFTASFQDLSQPDISKWAWEFGDGKTSVLRDPANIYLKPGNFDVKLTVTDVNGCTDTKIASQFIQVGGPYGSFSSVGSNSCTNQTVTFNANAVNAATLRWDYGDGVVEDKTTTQATHNYTSTGAFTPRLLLIDSRGCQTVADGSSVLLIKDTTAVSFKITPRCIPKGDPIRLIGESDTDNNLTWTWEIDGVFMGSGSDFQTSLNVAGLHKVTGYATNQFGCVSHVYDSVRIQGPIELIPNVITPNNDGHNDLFEIVGINNSVWDIDIVNRWGNLVHQERNYKGNWDGGNQPAGVYYYILKNAICDDKSYRGYISLHR
jgi:gliding motility-associated-like protein